MSKIFEHFRKFNLRNQIALFMIFGIVLTSLLLSSVGYYLYKSHVKEIVESETNDNLDVMTKASQSFIQHQIEMAEMFLVSSDISRKLINSSINDKYVNDNVSNFLQTNKNLLGVGIFNNYGKLLGRSDGKIDFKVVSQYLETYTPQYSFHFLRPNRFNGQLVTDLILQLKGPGQSLLGFIVFKISISDLERIIAPLEKTNNASYGMLYTRDKKSGVINLLIPEKLKNGKGPVIEADTAPSIFDEFKKPVYYTEDSSGNEVLVARKRMLTTDWNLILITNQESVFTSFYNRVWSLAVVVALLVLVMIYLSYKFSYVISKPLLKMSRQAEEIAKGNFDVSFVQEEGIAEDDERGELANSLEHMTKDIKKYIAFRDGFLSLAAHELKTPLTVIQSCLDLVSMSVGEDPVTVKKFTHMAQRQCKLLNVMINDLLEVSRIQMGRFKLKKKNACLGDLIEDLVNDLNSLDLKNPVILLNKNTRSVEYDEDRIKQVMMSLINNSIKYSKESTEIFINMEEVGAGLRVSIHDKGVGIPKEKQDQIFTQLYNDPATEPEKKTATLGVSLYVCKEIIEKHSGSIWFESKENVGTSFYFELPMHEQSIDFENRSKAA